jgi:hypothetical protein
MLMTPKKALALEILVAMFLATAVIALGTALVAEPNHLGRAWLVAGIALTLAVVIPGGVAYGSWRVDEQGRRQIRASYRKRLGRWYPVLPPLMLVVLLIIVVPVIGMRYIRGMFVSFSNGYRGLPPPD